MTILINEADRKKSLDDYITQLWNCHASHLRSYLRRNCGTDDAEDLLQTIFERLYRMLLGQESPEARITNIRAYLYKIADRVSLGSYWKNGKHVNSVVSADAVIDDEGHSLLDSLPDSSLSMEEVLLNREQILNLREQIELLPGRERVVLYYTYFDNRPLTEIAAIVGVSRSAISRTLSRAKNHLRKNLFLKELKERRGSAFFKEFTEPEQNSADSDSWFFDHGKLIPAVPELASQIAQLRDPYRSVLTLAMLERRKYAQIAALRGCPLGTIKVQISRGIHLLHSVQQPAELFIPDMYLEARELPYLDALPESHRTILTLREGHGLSYNCIARDLGISLSCVKKRLHCARVAYRALLDQQPRQPRMVQRRKSIPLDELSRLNHPAYHHFYEALRLAYIDHLSDEEIAACLHRPVNTIKAHIARGIKLLASVEPPEEQEISLLNA
jgi:RNA polymerase sigma factor (sigma-70 family)